MKQCKYEDHELKALAKGLAGMQTQWLGACYMQTKTAALPVRSGNTPKIVTQAVSIETASCRNFLILL